MYNKKCFSTFLFIVALVSLITLILPFMSVGLIGTPVLVVKIIYYFTIVLYAICLVLICVIGIFGLFKNNFSLLIFQEILAYIALFLLLINVFITSPIKSTGLSLGYSLILVETFILTCFNNILKLIKKLPKGFNIIKEYFKKRHEIKLKLEEERKLKEYTEEIKQKDEVIEIDNTTTFDDEKVEIIPADDEMI